MCEWAFTDYFYNVALIFAFFYHCINYNFNDCFAGTFFRENPLTGDRKNQMKPKKPIKDPILEKMKIWAEVLGVREHQNFMAMMAKERDLKNRIQDLSRLLQLLWFILLSYLFILLSNPLFYPIDSDCVFLK